MKKRIISLSIILLVLMFTNLVLAQEGINYFREINTEQEFNSISMPNAGRVGLERITKFLSPARDGVAFGYLVYQNVNRYPFHYEFMINEFPDFFGGLTQQEFLTITSYRDSRQYYAGFLYKIVEPQRGILYGFNVFTDETNEGEVLNPNELLRISEDLKKSFHIGNIVYLPLSQREQRKAQQWIQQGIDLGFEVYFFREDVNYVAYSQTANYGTVKVFENMNDFYDAQDKLSWQDIIVLPEAPTDIEGVIAGAITGTEQNILSHLNIRSQRRGTPNVFVKDALNIFKVYEGKLVRFEAGRDNYNIQEANIEEAQAWWNTHRPDVSRHIRDANINFFELKNLLEFNEQDDVTRYGGKASQLAKLYKIIDTEYQVRGLGIPFGYYEQFMNENKICYPNADGRCNEAEKITFNEFIRKMVNENPRFKSDSSYRYEVLTKFKNFIINDAQVRRGTALNIAVKIQEIWGNTRTMVRLRSSSNAEDALEFNGAGLYDSTSACAADTLDADNRGPSQCDRARSEERTIEKALKFVWASLWNYRAFEEREYFKIPQERAKMAILVTQAFPSEDANGVAFTGNPVNIRDNRYLINVQVGDESVVSPRRGVVAETDLLTIRNEEVEKIERVRHSSLLPDNWVLTDEQLKELGKIIAFVNARYPLDTEGYSRDRVILDFEFKFDNGQLSFKQVRPFLRPESEFFKLIIPEETETFGRFKQSRTLREEYNLKSKIKFKVGEYKLERNRDSFELDIIDSIEIGPLRERAIKQGNGRVSVTVEDFNVLFYTYKYVQEFNYKGEVLSLEIILHFELPGTEEIIFDDVALTNEDKVSIISKGIINGQTKEIFYRGTNYESLDLYKIYLTGNKGEKIELYYRIEPVENILLTGLADVVNARVNVNGEERIIDNYWNLVHAANKHNTGQKFMVIFENPINNINGVEIRQPENEEYNSQLVAYAATLNSNLEELGIITVASFSNRRYGVFIRGDADNDGRVTLTDAISILNHLFRGGSAPQCQDAADADDDGRLTLSDAIKILNRLFQGGTALPAPYQNLGEDPTQDGLTCG